ncbi:Tetratricopeptide repeat-containing protein [gut metagenome]|uniref:Tetratricopeptide repeat-containing protein n=1 Tax=gut metagenome TaxID=749906 RepID=J9CAB2_9ZZZZ
MVKNILLVCLISLYTFSLQAQTYQELTARSVEAAEQDSLQKAEALIRQALKLEPANPHNALLFSNLATFQRRQKKYDLALENYTYALNIAPRTILILLNRATLYLEMGKDDAACADYSLVLDMDSDHAEALSMRAYIYMRQRNYKLARADYQHLLKQHPSDFNGRLGLATLAQKEGKFEEAFQIINAMVQEETESRQPHSETLAMLLVVRAGIEKDLKQFDLALIDLETALQHHSMLADAYLTRGQIYLSQGKKRMAKNDFEQAMALGVPQADMRELISQCR